MARGKAKARPARRPGNLADPARRVLSIRWIVSGAAVALTAVTVLAVGGVGERQARLALLEEVQNRLILEARNLAMTSSRALISDYPELTLAPILSEMAQGRPEHAFATVVDREGRIRGDANPRVIGEVWELPAGLRELPTEVALREDERMLGDAVILVASAPVKHPDGHHIGEAVVGFQRDYVESAITRARRAQALLVAVMLLAGIVAGPVFISILLRPIGALRAGLERIGRGDLDTPVRLRDRTELGLLAETMNEMAGRIRVAQTERVEKERLAREVELAREIQSSLLPDEHLEGDGFRIDGAHRAAAEVGGDLWDVFPLPNNRVGLAIADVSGKGLAGCLVSSMLSALLRAFAPGEASPAALLGRLDLFLSLRPGTFITMFYGIFDPKDGSLVFASAAHSPLLVHRAATGESEWYQTKGIPIGAVRGGHVARSLEDRRIALAPGDLLVQYTDGINEAFDPAGQTQFGFERIARSVAAAAAGGGQAVIDRIRRDLSEWTGPQPPLDDETLLVLGISGATSVRIPEPAGGGGRAAPAAADDPLATLAEARRRGARLDLPADADYLSRVPDWLRGCTGLDGLDPRSRSLLETAVHEVCANVVEHGYGRDRSRTYELYWLPSADRRRGRGQFVLVDHGHEFAPDGSTVDFGDPRVRRRGRGIGLEIIREAMRDVRYHPGTPEGNVTILSFDPDTLRTQEVSR